jgi:hypothetical protein
MRSWLSDNIIEIELDAEIALGAHLDGGRGQSRRAHVLDRDDRARRHQLEAGFEQQFFGEGISDLNGRALLLCLLFEGGGCHGRAVDAVTAGLRAEIDDRIPDSGRLGVENLVLVGDADGHRVDQDVAVIALVEAGRTADRRHPKRIAIAADPGDDAADEMPGLRVIGRAETQEVQTGDRPRPHGENIAQNAADAGRRTLIGLDEGGVVMALHLEDAGLPVADVDDPGILARPLDYPRRFGRQIA